MLGCHFKVDYKSFCEAFTCLRSAYCNTLLRPSICTCNNSKDRHGISRSNFVRNDPAIPFCLESNKHARSFVWTFIFVYPAYICLAIITRLLSVLSRFFFFNIMDKRLVSIIWGSAVSKMRLWIFCFPCYYTQCKFPVYCSNSITIGRDRLPICCLAASKRLFVLCEKSWKQI